MFDFYFPNHFSGLIPIKKGHLDVHEHYGVLSSTHPALGGCYSLVYHI